jgi:hypothetical protein
VNEPVLTARALQRAVLARQLLLARATGPPAVAVSTVGGLQAQYAPSMYIGLDARLDGFGRPDLTDALQQRAVVQGTLQRITIHLVDASDYWPFALAVRTVRRQLWLRSYRERGDESVLVGAAERVRAALANGPLPRKEIEALVGKPLAAGVGLWLDLLRVPPSGTWDRRRADLYADAERELGPPTCSVAEAQQHLVRRYLTGFGPASRTDIASYTGLPVSLVGQVLGELDLRPFRDEAGTALVDVADGLLPDADVPAPVRFMPTWDATLLAHCRRTGILREADRPRIFTSKAPQSFPTFTLDGTVAGTWRYRDGEVTIAPFEPLAAAVRDEVAEAAKRVARLHA